VHAREKERKRVPLIKVDKREMPTDIKSKCEVNVAADDEEQSEIGYPKIEILDLEGSIERKSVKTLSERIFKGCDCIENDNMRRKWPKVGKGGSRRIGEDFSILEVESKHEKLFKGEDEGNYDESYDELGF